MDVQIPCPCPEKDGEQRHESDTVVLRERLDFFGASSVRNAVIALKHMHPLAGTAETMTVLSQQYLLRGVESWSLVDEKGKPVPVDEETVAAFMDANVDAAIYVSDAANELYGEVMLPLLLRALTPSPPSRTASSTSPTNGSRPKRRKPSRPSSITTIPTADIATTSSSLDGDSNLSRSSA